MPDSYAAAQGAAHALASSRVIRPAIRSRSLRSTSSREGGGGGIRLFILRYRRALDSHGTSGGFHPRCLLRSSGAEQSFGKDRVVRSSRKPGCHFKLLHYRAESSGPV